ncbi:MAG TPA: DNA mismatch repair endonuclease MutL [Ktedonobacterales bacterium]
MPIRQLPHDVAAKIAAGEVVERPASVVKELVENSLDAGARHIRVELAGGGLEMIRVTDDGAGIPRDELALAFSRHATSKIATVDDLERIGTLGFRGEALASIAAVSHVALISRHREAEAGAQITVVAGEGSDVTAAASPTGATITVRGLFASVPARLKFLKSRPTETSHCLHLIEHYALAWPEVQFSVTSEGRRAFETLGDGKLKQTITSVYGLSIAEQMVSLDTAEETPFGEEPQPEDRPVVTGYLSLPTCYKSTRQFMSFFVNRRWVQSRTLTFAVEEAYHSLLLMGRHPLAIINISIDPGQLDVNVHPAKTEVRFLRERQVYAAVQRAARAAVLANAETPAISSSVFSVPVWAMPLPASDTPPAPGQRVMPASAPVSAPAEVPAQGELIAPPTAPPSLQPLPGPQGQPAPTQAPLVGGSRLPVMRVLGQVSQSYIVAEGPEGVYMVDQHAAHERILLERMVEQARAQGMLSQQLLQPLPIELAPQERERLDDHSEQLRALGFDLEPFGHDTVLVRAIPSVLGPGMQSHALRDLLVDLAGADAGAASHGETWDEHALANVACKAAIKAGQALSPDEMRELLRQLEETHAPGSCCHGRPTMVHLSLSALEREFDRR